MLRFSRHFWLYLVGAAVLGLTSGCQTISLPFLAAPPVDETLSPEITGSSPPEQLIAIWSDTTFQAAGKPATRGLGGRLYFYDGQRKAVPVAGQLIVYGFDDAISGGSHQTPDRKYVITPEEFVRHHSETDLGSSYSIWIPWDAVGGPQKPVSVLPVFTSTDGKILMGELARHLLPGKKSAVEPSPAAEATRTTTSELMSARSRPAVIDSPSADVSVRSPVALAGFEADATNSSAALAVVSQVTAPSPHDPLRTTTIAVPPLVRERLLQSAPAADEPTERSTSSVMHQRVATSAALGFADGERALPLSAPQGQNHLPPPADPASHARPFPDRRPAHGPGPIPSVDRGARSLPPRARFALPRHPVPGAPIALPEGAPPPTPRFPSGPAALLPSSP